MARIQVAPKLASESRTDVVDFSPLLLSGQTVYSASTSISVYSGVDPSPAAVLVGTSVATPLVNVAVTGGVAGAIYQLRVDAVTLGPAGTLSLAYYLAITPDVP